MNWSDQINRFEPLTKEDVPLFASPTEMEQAITTYNRAIINLHQDSQDIARIALRKLASAYPLFPQPAFLLGCLMARSGKKKEAAELIDQALSAALPEDLQEDAEKCLLYVQVRRQEQPETGDEQNAAQDDRDNSPAALGATQILERTRRRGRVRMASKRERRNVLRNSEFPEEKETKVHMRQDPVKLLRFGLPILALILVVVTLIMLGIRWIPSLNLQARRDDDSQKLTWLLTRLDQLALEDKAVAELLDSYQAQFQPDASAQPTEQNSTTTQESVQTQTTNAVPLTPTLSPVPTQPPPTPSPSPQPSPTPDPAITSLQEAAALLETGRSLLRDNLADSGMALVQARLLLADIPGETTADGVPADAFGLSREVEALISDIAVSAANALRLRAQPLFNDGAYEEALIYYEAAYALYPRSYGGGVAYYLGRCYQLLNQPVLAKTYFEFVIEQFSGRDIATSAAYRLREMGY